MSGVISFVFLYGAAFAAAIGLFFTLRSAKLI